MNLVYTVDDLEREVAQAELELLERFERFLKGYAETWRRFAKRELTEEKEASSQFQVGLCAGIGICYKGCAKKLEDELKSVERKIEQKREFLEELEACVAGKE